MGESKSQLNAKVQLNKNWSFLVNFFTNESQLFLHKFVTGQLTSCAEIDI